MVIGACIQYILEQADKGVWYRPLVLLLDDRFNLRYLADRLQFERTVIRDYLGEVNSRTNKPSDLVSIISPHYGKELRYVRSFIRSVQRQTYSNWELCLCIDGDPDVRVCRYLQHLNEKDPDRYRIVKHNQNQGICAATESALTLAQGELVVFADTDDVLHNEALAAVVKGFSSDDQVDLVYTNNDILSPWGYRIDPIYKPAWSPELLLVCNYINHLVAIRINLLKHCENLWAQEVNDAQDWDMLFRITPLARRIHHIPIVLYHWRAHEHSTSTNAKPWAFKAMDRLQENYLSNLDDRLYWDWDHNDGPAPIRFRDNQAPPLYIFEIHDMDNDIFVEDSPTESKYSYPGHVHVQRVYVEGTLEDKATDLDNVVNVVPEVDALILFICADLQGASLQGSIETQAAYVALPEVACAWPFFDEWRGTYTVQQGILCSQLRQSSFFTNWSGNILTGPLHGLMIKHEVWHKFEGFRACCDQEVPKLQPIHTLGALFGLRALQERMRNVAVRTVRCDWRPPVLELGKLTPKCDPYV